LFLVIGVGMESHITFNPPPILNTRLKLYGLKHTY